VTLIRHSCEKGCRKLAGHVPPFTWPTQAERDAWLGKLALAWAPGTIAVYSNPNFTTIFRQSIEKAEYA
jgi:hypothetical protein